MAKFRRKLVWQRANGCCEYCRLPQEYSVLPHEIDHIGAKKHRGVHAMENACLACAQCNASKGPNVAGHDPDSDALVPLFNPRIDLWDAHFEWVGPTLVGKTAVGRTTVDVLNVNDPLRVELRSFLILAGLFPPES